MSERTRNVAPEIASPTDIGGGDYFKQLIEDCADATLYSAACLSPDEATVEAALANDVLPETLTLETELLREAIMGTLVTVCASVYVQGGRDAIIAHEIDEGDNADEIRFVPVSQIRYLVEQARDESGIPLNDQYELIRALTIGSGVRVYYEPTDDELFTDVDLSDIDPEELPVAPWNPIDLIEMQNKVGKGY